MDKKLTFDSNKYFYSCIKKFIIYVFSYILFVFLFMLFNKAINGSVLKVFGLILLLFIGYLLACFYINYKYYLNDNFECVYNKDYISYHHLRFVKLFEGFTALSSNYVRVALEVAKIDKVELKRGKIYIYGLMTLEKEATRLKQKVIKKFSFPDYFKETEEFIKIVNNI